MQNENRQQKIIVCVILVVLALLSFSVVGRLTSSATWSFNAATIQSLDEKKATVMELTAASTAASVVISLIPGDAGSAIAEKLADFSGYFLIVLCAIYLEKYLLTITGFLAFRVLVPIALLLAAIWIFARKDALLQIAAKAALFGIAIFLVVPTSQWASSLIETTYSASIQETLEEAKETTKEIQQRSAVSEAESEAAQSENAEPKSGILGSISSFLDQGAAAVQNGASAITEGASRLANGAGELREKAEALLNRLIESLAILLVTACLIPIAVIFFYIWLVKILLGVRIDLPKLPKRSRRSLQ